MTVETSSLQAGASPAAIRCNLQARKPILVKQRSTSACLLRGVQTQCPVPHHVVVYITSKFNVYILLFSVVSNASSPKKSPESGGGCGHSDVTIFVIASQSSNVGPMLDAKKVGNLPEAFGPGPIHRVLRESVSPPHCFFALKYYKLISRSSI